MMYRPARIACAAAFLMAGGVMTDASASLMGAAADRPLVRTRGETIVSVDPTSGVAHFEILEEFLNNSGSVTEADYLFPVPRGAVFTNLSLYAGETELRGEMLRFADAHRIYEDIVRRLKDPALVELAGKDLIRARVFPIQPGETRKIVLRYTQVLARPGDTLRVSLPRRVGLMTARQFPPRVAPHLPPIESPGPQRRLMQPTAASSLLVRISHAETVGNPYSPTSRIDVQRTGDELVVRQLMAAHRPSHDDFELFVPLRTTAVGATLVSHSPAPGDERGYFMFLVRPPADADTVRVARDLTFVLDVSGSMSGLKIEQARSAISQALRDLRAGDRFRLLTFSSAVREFRSGYTEVSPDAVEQADAYLRGVAADGGTNIDDALRRALQQPATAGRMSIVLFMTDGLPTVNETDPVLIAQTAEAARGEHRVFAFGIGDDVNTFLLDHLVQTGRGAVDYVRPGEDVAEAVGNLTRRISAPVLTDLRIVSAPVLLEDLSPGRIPDLFHGEDLVLFGRYRGDGAGQLVLEGRRNGRRVEYGFEVTFAERRLADDFVARLWATRKAAELSTALRLNGHDPELVEEIRQLGLRYGVLTEFTAYLVQEPSAALDRAVAERRAVQLMAAPTEQTGSAAVDGSARRSELAQAGEWEVAKETMAEFVAASGSRAEWRQVGRRLFVLEAGNWRDIRVDKTVPAVSIVPYSDAWFELAARLPGLVPALQLGERVTIAATGLVLRIDTDGRTRLDASAWHRVETAFRPQGR